MSVQLQLSFEDKQKAKEVKTEIIYEKGWKEEENQRYGKVLVVKFNNIQNGYTMFRYAPKLHEKEFWDKMWIELKVYDDKLTKERVGKMTDEYIK
jgi:hypothetical protein